MTVKLNSFSLKGFPKGVSDLSASLHTPEGACREAINIDFDHTGKFGRRRGYSSVYTGTALDSLWSDGKTTLFREGSALKRLWPDFTTTTLATGFTDPINFLSFNDVIYFSSGTQTGCVVEEAVLPWGVPTFFNSDLTLTAIDTGDMYAGTYLVACTYVDATGEEGGTSAARTVSVPEGGGIIITDIPAVTGATHTNVYVSAPNGGDCYLYTTVLARTPTVVVSSHVSDIPLETSGGRPPPAGWPMEQHHGRIYIAQGKVLWATEPFRPGLHFPATGYRLFPDDITMLVTTGGGLYVGTTERVYLRGGIDSEQEQQRTVLNCGVVPGRNWLRLPDDNIAFYTPRGWAFADHQGVVKLVQEQLLAPHTYQNCSAVLRVQDGLTHLIAQRWRAQ